MTEQISEEGRVSRKKIAVGFILTALFCMAIYYYFFYGDSGKTDSEKKTGKTDSEKKTEKTDPVVTTSRNETIKVLDLPQDDQKCIGRCGQTLKREVVCINATTKARVHISMCAGLPDPENIPLNCPKCSWDRTVGACNTDCGTGTRRVTFVCNEENPKSCGEKPNDTEEPCNETSTCDKILVDGEWVWSDDSATTTAPVNTDPVSNNTLMKNITFGEGTKAYARLPGTTEGACWRACAEDAICDWAEHSGGGMLYMQDCKLYQSSQPPTVYSTYINAMSKEGCKQVSKPDARCISIPGYSCMPGEVYHNSAVDEADRLENVASVTECSDKCTELGAECTFFSHSRPYKTCYLKGGVKANLIRSDGDEATYTKRASLVAQVPSLASSSPPSRPFSFRGWL